MRVLVPLLATGSGNEPFYYLMSRLRDMDFTVLTFDPAVAEACKDKNLDYLLLENPPIYIPRWLEKRRFTQLGKHLYEFIEEYRSRQQDKVLAKIVIEKVKPDAILLSGDFKGILYSLCQYQDILSVVVQITLDWLNLDTQLAHFRARQGHKGEQAKKILHWLSKITGRQMMGRVRGEDFAIYGTDIGRTLGAVLAGVRFGIPVKGGMGARYVCVNGEAYRESFLEAGLPAEKIVITGSPDHDRLVEMQKNLPDKQRLRDALGIPSNCHLVTLFAQPFTPVVLPGIDYLAELTWIAQTLTDALPDITLVIKLHPIQSLSDFPNLLQLPRVQVVASAEGEDFNNRLIDASRLVILRTSTVGYNALAMDVPVLSYSFLGNPVENYFRDVGGSLHVENRADFIAGVKNLLYDEAKRTEVIEMGRQARRHHMILDGQCCARIGDVLRSS